VRALPNSESAISSDFVTDLSVLPVRGVLPGTTTDILGLLQSAAVNHARARVVLSKQAGDEGGKCRDRRKQRREQDKSGR